jgi:hypothetical protein
VHWAIRRLTLPPGVALVSDVSSVVVDAYGYYDADINKINMKAIDLVGDYRSVGSTKALAVHNVTGDRHISVGALIVAQPQATFTFVAKDVVDIMLTDATQKTTLHKLLVKSQLGDARIYVDGNIGTISAGSIIDTIIFAGVDNDVSTLPLAPIAFINKEVTIKAVKVKGAFANTLIASYNISTILLGDVIIDNMDVVHRVSAQNIKRCRYAYSNDDTTTKVNLKQLGGGLTTDRVDDFLVNILPISLL